MAEKLNSDAINVLGILMDSAGDGYTVMKRSGLNRERLSTALRQIPAEVLIIKGGLTPETVGDAYMAIAPDAKKYVDFLVRQ